MTSLYMKSWELYKKHSEKFTEDFSYYKKFCSGYKTLDIFAGYGRLTNYLSQCGIDIEAVELESNLSKFIELASNKLHTLNFLDFESTHQYERIISGYNSFALLVNDDDFFECLLKIKRLLSIDGVASLSYYPLNSWNNNYVDYFTHENQIVRYSSRFDYSCASQGVAVWIDVYEIGAEKFEFNYPVRIINQSELREMSAAAGLSLIDVIYDYSNPNMSYNGWCEYVFKRNLSTSDDNQ